MTCCTFPTLTQADVAALGDIESATARAAKGCKVAVDGAVHERSVNGERPCLLSTCRHVPNHARHVPPVLRSSLNAFQHDHCPGAIRVRALSLLHVCAWRAARSGRSVVAGIRPRRVTIDGLVIVRGRR